MTFLRSEAMLDHFESGRNNNVAKGALLAKIKPKHALKTQILFKRLPYLVKVKMKMKVGR